MWTAENRSRYNRDRLRYPSDLTDEKWSSCLKRFGRAAVRFQGVVGDT
jgi:hypothetical protein